MPKLNKNELKAIANVSGITGLPLDDVISLVYEKNADVVARGVPSISGTRFLDETIDKRYRRGDEVKSCWGCGMTHLIHGIACPYMRQTSWTDKKANERKAIAYCTHIKPFDISEEYMQRNLVINTIEEITGKIPKMRVSSRVRRILDSTLVHGNISIKVQGIVYNAARQFCDRTDDGFPYFCPLLREKPSA